MLPQHDPLFMQPLADRERLKQVGQFTSLEGSTWNCFNPFFSGCSKVYRVISKVSRGIFGKVRPTGETRQMSKQHKEHVPFRFLMRSPISFPLNLQAEKRRKKGEVGEGGGLLLASRGCVICRGHLRSLVAALFCSLCQRWCWNRCAPHPGLCWNQLRSGTMWQMIPI